MSRQCAGVNARRKRCQGVAVAGTFCSRHTNDDISLQPIEDYLTRHDLKLSDLFPQESYEAKGNQQDGSSQEASRIIDEARPAWRRWEGRLYRARARGGIDPYLADEFCCELLHRHPSEVYGPAWFEQVAA